MLLSENGQQSPSGPRVEGEDTNILVDGEAEMRGFVENFENATVNEKSHD